MLLSWDIVVVRDRYRAWRDWCPPRSTYLIPAALLGLAIAQSLIVTGRLVDASQPLRGLIASLVAVSGTLALAIWIKRAMNAPDEQRRAD